jgi:hypothetical protein
MITRRVRLHDIWALPCNISTVFINARGHNKNMRKNEQPIDPDPSGNLKRIMKALDRMLKEEEGKT